MYIFFFSQKKKKKAIKLVNMLYKLHLNFMENVSLRRKISFHDQVKPSQPSKLLGFRATKAN